MLETMYLAILIGAGLVMAAVFTSWFAFRFGAPILLIFLAIGLIAGEDGLGIEFDNAEAAYFLGSIALSIILFDSGFGTRLSSFRQAAFPAIVLATIGVLVTTGLVGLAAHLVLGLPWSAALLLGAVVSSTDAAAVFFLLRVGGIHMRDRVRAVLEVESGVNDPMAIFLVITLVEVMTMGASEAGLALGFAEVLPERTREVRKDPLRVLLVRLTRKRPQGRIDEGAGPDPRGQQVVPERDPRTPACQRVRNVLDVLE